MIRGPDGLRHHVLFIPREPKVALNTAILDEVESWLALNLNRDDYHYNRYTMTSSAYVFDLANVFNIKLRWSEIIVFN
jgi:hypothetical protein